MCTHLFVFLVTASVLEVDYDFRSHFARPVNVTFNFSLFKFVKSIVQQYISEAETGLADYRRIVGETEVRKIPATFYFRS